MAPRKVRKRDGREVAFDARKVADAITRAARSVGNDDRLLAEELASVVTLFLEREFANRVPAIEQIQDLVEKVLIETGHARMAKSYILYRERRRAIREHLRVHKSSRTATGVPAGVARAGDGSASVDVAGCARQSRWSKRAIVESLVTEAGLPVPVAEDVASGVEARVFQSGLTRLSTSLLRELIDNELFERGLDIPLAQQGMVGLSPADIDSLLRNECPREAPHAESHGAPRGSDAERDCGRAVYRRYALARLLPGDVVEAHLDGRLHLDTLWAPTRVVSGSLTAGAAKADRGGATTGRALFETLGARARLALGMVDESLFVHGVVSRLAERADDSLAAEPLSEAAASVLLALTDPDRLGAPGRVVLVVVRSELEDGDPAATGRGAGRGLHALASLVEAASELASDWAIPALRIELSQVLLEESSTLTRAVLLEQTVPGAVQFARPEAGGLCPRAPLAARVGLNMVRIVAAARGGTPRELEDELDEAARLAARACHCRLRALDSLVGWAESGGESIPACGDGLRARREAGGVAETRGVRSVRLGIGPRCGLGWLGHWHPRYHAVLVPVLLDAALAYAPSGAASRRDGAMEAGEELGGVMVERLRRRFALEAERLGFTGEIGLADWPEATGRLARISSEVEPEARLFIEETESPRSMGIEEARAIADPARPVPVPDSVVPLREESVPERIAVLRAAVERAGNAPVSGDQDVPVSGSAWRSAP